jgi:hypothetical protein
MSSHLRLNDCPQVFCTVKRGKEIGGLQKYDRASFIYISDPYSFFAACILDQVSLLEPVNPFVSLKRIINQKRFL